MQSNDGRWETTMQAEDVAGRVETRTQSPRGDDGQDRLLAVSAVASLTGVSG
jgi:hypothetical protein